MKKPIERRSRGRGSRRKKRKFKKESNVRTGIN
jgi:hypothetical protein